MSRKEKKRSARHIYVIRLKRSVLELRRFKKRNPECDQRKRPLYVGLTGKDPKERIAEHKRGYKASSIVKRYGKSLWEEKGRKTYRSHKRALEIERETAAKLRAQGYPVWQG